MTRGGWVGVGLLGVCGVCGCVGSPFFTRDLQSVEGHVASLEQRVNRLEVSRGLPPTTFTDPGVSAIPGALPDGTGPAPSEAGLESAAGGVPGGADSVLGAAEGAGAPLLPPLPFNSRDAFGKLLRGITNVLTGWVELPKRVHETSQAFGPGAGMSLGVIRGIGYGLIRTAAGLYEVVSFPFPAPPGYRPVMQPPYIFTPEENSGASP